MPGVSRAALVTGVGRSRSIGAGLAVGLARDGWDLALGYWTPYDDRLGYERTPEDPGRVAEQCRALGSNVVLLPGDLTDVDVPDQLVTSAARELGPLSALVMSHCESVDSSILTTSVDDWDRHFAVNARATWLLIKAFANQLTEAPGARRRGARQDRRVDQRPHRPQHALWRQQRGHGPDRHRRGWELADLGVRANVINPGPIDTGWMSEEIRAMGVADTPAGRLGSAEDTARLVRFLLSEEGSWINGQLLHSNGGFRSS